MLVVGGSTPRAAHVVVAKAGCGPICGVVLRNTSRLAALSVTVTMTPRDSAGVPLEVVRWPIPGVPAGQSVVVVPSAPFAASASFSVRVGATRTTPLVLPTVTDLRLSRRGGRLHITGELRNPYPRPLQGELSTVVLDARGRVVNVWRSGVGTVVANGDVAPGATTRFDLDQLRATPAQASAIVSVDPCGVAYTLTRHCFLLG